MAGFNPFAPQAEKKQGAPQAPGVQAPNVQMQDQPGLAQTLAPTVFSKAMGSEAAGEMGTAMTDSIAGKWASLTAAPTAAISAPQAAGMAELAASTGGTLAPGAAQAVMGSSALAAPVVASAAGTTGLAATAGTAGGALASAAPMAAALGPFGIPVLIGAGLMAANSGK
jgi:hypothetical protein